MAQLHGGYLVPGSTLDDLHLVVSQWNATTNWPYRNPSNDARPWVRFCLEAHYVHAESVLRRIRESGEVWIKVEQLRQDSRLPERLTAALFDTAIGLRVRNSSYRALLRDWDEAISTQAATTDLRAMVKPIDREGRVSAQTLRDSGPAPEQLSWPGDESDLVKERDDLAGGELLGLPPVRVRGSRCDGLVRSS